MLLDRRVLDEDCGDDQELTGKGDDARHSGFHDTHFNFLLSESDPAPTTLLTDPPPNLNCKGRHKQLRFLQPPAEGLQPPDSARNERRSRLPFAFFASLRVSQSAFCIHAKIREEREESRTPTARSFS